MLSKMSAHVKIYDGETNDIWNKVSNNIRKELDCQPIWNKKIKPE